MWSGDMSMADFSAKLRLIEPTLSVEFCGELFSKLKNREGVVEMATFANNLWGAEEDTIDHRAAMFKDFYRIIYQGGFEKRYIQACEDHDKNNNGEVTKDSMKKVLA